MGYGISRHAVATHMQNMAKRSSSVQSTGKATLLYPKTQTSKTGNPDMQRERFEGTH